jgi:hypothetical protein
MAFGIARAVLALPVWLIGQFGVYLCPGRTSTSKVCLNIADMYDKPCAGHVYRLRRIELVLCCDAVEPDSCPTDANLPMNRSAVPTTLDTPRLEAKGSNQEVMSCLDVATYQHGDDALECSHFSFSYQAV